MPLVKYRIYELSARAVISYGRQQDGAYTFHLSAVETEKCKSLSAPHEQDDNALFYQTMCVLHGDAFTGAPEGQLVTDLSDVIFYMDFSGIFDRSGARKKHLIRQEKARALFRPEGVSLDFGSGAHRYLAFERSGSMSRQARLAFIREDFYDTVCRRIMMDMTIGDCQLSKLYAYNGLMLSSGIRIDGIGIDRPHRVVVIDNPTRTERNVSVITVEDDGTQSSTRKYHRVEKKEDIEITCFDGEGLISKEYARVVDEKLCGKKVHTSFQIRMPYVKGMLHEVDFKDFLTLCGTDTITDLWGEQHPIQKVDIILTNSMFKGYGWLNAETMEIQYGTHGMPDIGANQMYYNAKESGPISTMPDIPGLAVWHEGHIGVYIGNGQVVEAMGTKYGVVKTELAGRGWTHWLKVPYINYD